ncbi:MAG TPA: T9SS type A sorting domain-containing protein [Ignavibacteria bacterium]|nr:T9SS type A sorting domain-containing protein [Ignavibacteria bacterium]
MKRLSRAIIIFVTALGIGIVSVSKNSLKADQSETQILNPFNLLFPPTGLTFVTEPGNNTQVDITWSSAGAAATYKWKFGAPTINSVILSLSANNNGTSTALTVTPAAVDGILAGLGLNPGDSVSGEWAVWAYEGNDSLKSVQTFNITFKRKVVLNQFNLVSPPSGITLVTSPENNAEVNIIWKKSSAGATYKWKFGAPNINSVLLEIPSNNAGSDTMLTVTPAAVDGILAGLGLNPGDSVSGQWAVYAYNETDSLKSVETHNITFRRSKLASFGLLFPPTGITFVSEQGNNTPVNINWNKSADGVTYKWKFGSPNVALNTILDLASNNNGMDTVLTVTPAAVDGILAGLGLNPGDSVPGQWAVWAYLNGDSLKSAQTFDITFRRDNKNSISQIGSVIPDIYSLSQNYPNPFNPSTKINFGIPETGQVNISVFDMSGREVSVVLNENKSPGNYEISFNGANLSSGIYYYRISVLANGKSFIDTKKMTLIK